MITTTNLSALPGEAQDTVTALTNSHLINLFDVRDLGFVPELSGYQVDVRRQPIRSSTAFSVEACHLLPP